MVPFSYKASSAVSVRVDREGDINVLVIEFRYATYRLELDDREKAELIFKHFQLALGKKQPPQSNDVDLPKFYQEKKR